MKLRGPGLVPKRGDPWSCSARSVAVDDARDQAFVAAGSRVEIYNLQVLHVVVRRSSSSSFIGVLAIVLVVTSIIVFDCD